MKVFQQKLLRIARKNYGYYRDLRGGFRIGKANYNLFFVQSDPLAPPSQMEVKIPLAETGLPLELIVDEIDRIAMCDFIHRKMFPIACEPSRANKEKKRPGAIGLPPPAPQILERTAVQIKKDAFLSIRFAIVLPDDQRSVDAEAAVDLLLHRLPDIVTEGCWWGEADRASFLIHRQALRRQCEIRAQLDELGLIAFVANGSILPRAAGDSTDPLSGALPFSAPPEMECSISAAGETLVGMGVPRGITLIVGGGFHGKSTLLHAIEQGVYNHIPGDGREGVISLETAVKVRSEEGRWVNSVDLSWFVSTLPGGYTTDRFSTTSASGATSQATGLIEALEAGSAVLLLDEDASAVNFLLRDARMQLLVAKEREPLIPLIDRIPDLKARGVSLIMVVGASGDLLDIADHVIAMEEYQPIDRTEQAAEVCRTLPSRRKQTERSAAPALPSRRPQLLQWGKKSKTAPAELRPKAIDANQLRIGDHLIHLAGVEQLVDRTQVQAIGTALLWAIQTSSPEETMDTLFARVQNQLDQEGLEGFSAQANGDLSRFRIQEFAAALCRLRGLEMEISIR